MKTYHFKIQSRSYDEIKREGSTLLVCVTNKDGLILGYEVVTLKKHPAEIIKGKSYPERESYPKNEDFGEYGKSYQRLQDAEKQYESLTRKPNLAPPSRNVGHLKVNPYLSIPKALSAPKKSLPLKRKRPNSSPKRIIDMALM